MVCEPDTRLNTGCLGEPVITSYSQTGTHGQISQRDRILKVSGIFFRSSSGIEVEKFSTSGQINCHETRLQIRIRQKTRTRAIGWVCDRRGRDGVAGTVQAHRVKVESRDPGCKFLTQPRSHDLRSESQIVLPFHISQVRLKTEIREVPSLRDRQRRVIADVRTWIIVDIVPAEERIDRQQSMRAERVLVAWCNVECHHLLPLILSRLIECVRNLEPIARRVKIHMKNIVPPRL